LAYILHYHSYRFPCCFSAAEDSEKDNVNNDNDKAEGFASLSSERQTKHGIVVPFGARTANAGNSQR
jgi:hypothetical protein